jgi:hypothetical protein
VPCRMLELQHAPIKDHSVVGRTSGTWGTPIQKEMADEILRAKHRAALAECRYKQEQRERFNSEYQATLRIAEAEFRAQEAKTQNRAVVADAAARPPLIRPTSALLTPQVADDIRKEQPQKERRPCGANSSTDVHKKSGVKQSCPATPLPSPPSAYTFARSCAMYVSCARRPCIHTSCTTFANKLKRCTIRSRHFPYVYVPRYLPFKTHLVDWVLRSPRPPPVFYLVLFALMSRLVS